MKRAATLYPIIALTASFRIGNMMSTNPVIDDLTYLWPKAKKFRPINQLRKKYFAENATRQT